MERPASTLLAVTQSRVGCIDVPSTYRAKRILFAAEVEQTSVLLGGAKTTANWHTETGFGA